MDNNQNVIYLHLDDIIPNRFQPREVFDEKALKELAVSIKEHGVIQPIIVREINNNKYEIIAGERRYKASALAGMTKIPAIVRNLDDKEAAKVALLENLQRKNLNPIEEARTYQKIIELDDMTQEELAKTMGKSQSAVANKIRLLALPLEVQDALLKDEISERHARALLNIKDSDSQITMLEKVIKEKMTVRKLEEEIKRVNMPNNEKIENNADLNSLINPQPVKIEQEETKNNSFLMNPLPANNEKEEIINYGEVTNEEDDIEEDDGTTASELIKKPINLDELKKQSFDIGDFTKKNEEELNRDVDSIFNIQNPVPFNNKKDVSTAEQALKESEDKNYVDKEDYFSAPDLMNVNMPTNTVTTPTENMFANKPIPEQSFDSIIGFNSITPNIPKEETKEETPIENTNDNVSLGAILMNEAQEKENNSGYNVKDMVDSIRETIKKLELRGAKIDTDEMNFEDEYQILIKISKNIDD